MREKMQDRETSISTELLLAIEKFSGHPALRTENGEFTYGELGAAVATFSAILREQTEEGEFVAIEAERQTASIVAIIAALNTGRPFVFLDHRDSDTRNAEKTALLNVRTLAISDDKRLVPQLVDLPLRWRSVRAQKRAIQDSRRIAYAINTSGSTGEPKCVLVAFEPLAPLIHDHVDRLGLGPGKRTLQFSRLTFDGCITEILWSLTSGACLVLVGESDLAPGPALAEILERFEITHIKTTPFALSATEPTSAMSLEHVINGGGACRPAIVRAWSAFSAVHNAYGLTETTVCNLLSDDLRSVSFKAGVPLGSFVGCGAFEIINDSSDDTSSQRGELVLSGDCVAIGYLTDDGIEPFRDVGGELVFRTGDIVELIEDDLHFVERVDRQLKIRGFRIDPGEVEIAACQHPLVREAIAIEEPHENDEEPVLAMYFQGDAEVRDLRSYLASTLDAYKIPSVITCINGIPYTANGKVDRDALRATRRSLEFADEFDTSPSEAHPILLTVRRLTGVVDVGREDNFFDLGGDSVGSLALVSDLRELGWASAGARDVLRAPSLGALIDRLEKEVS